MKNKAILNTWTTWAFPTLALMTTPLWAQDLTSKQGETMLPEEGDYALGFDADPFLNYVGNFLNQGSGSSQPLSGSNTTLVGKMFKDAQTAYRGRVRLGFGHNSGIYGDPFDQHGSTYYDARVDTGWDVNEQIKIDLGIQQTYFDSAPVSRPRSDQWVQGYNLRAITNFDLCFGRLEGNTEIYHGGFTSLDLGDLSSGIAVNDRTLVKGNYEATYRLDGANEGDTGWEHQTTVQTRFYNVSGSRDFDTSSLRLSQALNYRAEDNKTFWNRLSFQRKNWRGLDVLDSKSLRFATGVTGDLDCGLHYRVGANVEHRDYQGGQLSDRTELGGEVAVEGSHGGWDWNAFANYGIQDRNAVNSFQVVLTEGHGLRCGVGAKRALTDSLSLALWYQDLHLDSAFVSDLDSSYRAGGVRLEKDLCERSSIGAGIEVQRIAYESGPSELSDTSQNYSIFYNRRF